MLTRLFGEIEVDENKVITFENGIIGFDFMKRFMLIHDADDENGSIKWLQSLDEGSYALPIIDPLRIDENYNPTVEDELLKAIDYKEGDDVLVFVTITVPQDITNMTCNMIAPIIINPENRKACQILTESEEYGIKYPVYDILKARKDGE